MEFTIPVGPALKKAEEEAHNLLTKSLQQTNENIIGDLMRRPYFTHRGRDGQVADKGGVIYQLLKEKIDTYALSDEFEAKIQAAIQRYMDAEADAAVRAMLNSAARKRVFSVVPHK